VREESALLGHTLLQKVRLEVDLEEDLPWVHGDLGALGSALMNLCINAVDAMPAGGTLAIRTRSLEGGQVELAVEDTGEGMEPEVLQRALEPFFTTKPYGRGTGLGLSMVYSTVKAHGGTLGLDSTPGLGTRIHIRLPGVAGPVAPADPAGTVPEPMWPLRILLVDDDELIREAAPELLGLLGHHVIIAGSGTAGLEALESDPDIDVVILDVNMPDMDGEETLARIRERWPELPVVLATGYLREDLKAAISPGSRVFSLPKPYTLEEARRALVEATRPVEGPLFS